MAWLFYNLDLFNIVTNAEWTLNFVSGYAKRIK
jgi:hypothetical protein